MPDLNEDVLTDNDLCLFYDMLHERQEVAEARDGSGGDAWQYRRDLLLKLIRLRIQLRSCNGPRPEELAERMRAKLVNEALASPQVGSEDEV